MNRQGPLYSRRLTLPSPPVRCAAQICSGKAEREGILQVVRDVALRKETVTSGDRVTKLQNYEDDPVLFECVALGPGGAANAVALTPMSVRCCIAARCADTPNCRRS